MADPNMTIGFREMELEMMRRAVREAEGAERRRWQEELGAQAHMSVADRLAQEVIPNALESAVAQIADVTRTMRAPTAAEQLAEVVRDQRELGMIFGPTTADTSPRLRLLPKETTHDQA